MYFQLWGLHNAIMLYIAIILCCCVSVAVECCMSVYVCTCHLNWDPHHALNLGYSNNLGMGWC